MIYVATVDGLLHTFGVDYDANDDYSYNGNHLDDYGHTGNLNEMWSFVPPATRRTSAPAAGSERDGAARWCPGREGHGLPALGGRGP